MTTKDINNTTSSKTIKDTKRVVWENLQYFVLALTIFGQVAIGAMFLLGQGAWLIANVIAVVRDFVLHRPHADIVKDSSMTALTIGIIVAYLLGFY